MNDTSKYFKLRIWLRIWILLGINILSLAGTVLCFALNMSPGVVIVGGLTVFLYCLFIHRPV